MGSPRGDEDGPTEETRVPAVGCNMATQRQRNVVNIAPTFQLVGTLGALEKAKMAKLNAEEDFQMSARWRLKDKARCSRWQQGGIE